MLLSLKDLRPSYSKNITCKYLTVEYMVKFHNTSSCKMSKSIFDVCVIGAGVMGSSTAYHLSRSTNLEIALIGPGEPKYKSLNSDVFGCHYDEGRITRIISPIESEQILAYRSTLGYAELEKESGINIFSETGFAAVGETGDEYIGEFSKMTDIFCEKNSLECCEMSPEFAANNWVSLVVPPNCFGRYSKKHNGYISVRNLVNACQQVFLKNGGHRIQDVAKQIKKFEDDFEIQVADETVIKAKKIVLTCGSFTNFFDLIPSQKLIDVRLIGHTVMKFELHEADFDKLDGLPSLIYKPKRDISDYVYILPPIRYPNGKIYIKFGHTVHPDNDKRNIGQQIKTLEEVKEWYCQSEYSRAEEFFQTKFSEIFPTISPVSTELDFCVMAITPSGKQYIDFLGDGLLLGTGGNGKSAKFGLEIGLVCAKAIVKGDWDYDLDKDQFSVQFKI